MASLPLLRLSLHPSPQTLNKPYFPSPSLAVRSPQTLKKSYLPSASLAVLIPHSLRSTIKISPRRPTQPPSKKTICMSYQTVPATDRLISVVAYFLPFFNGLQYGRFLFTRYPNLGLLLEPILPFLSFYKSIPYASFVAFFALYLGVVRNPSFNRYVRFNSMQAVVLDVLLVLPLLIQRIINPGKGLGFRFLVMGYNAIFVFIVACFLYSVGFCILGRTPYLPFVADAAERQL
ncbi:protein TIC 20-II, chloroplastic [Macadamia integrifolia]|uniref:protein TIC 20-II, chloroplastic n=1 Tax=Macadamia integrifolia TaxID=60698 RepID=UPI001C4F035C|nr:protein TIC 20-II, chloroplastic [Macadamia integrifolia]